MTILTHAAMLLVGILIGVFWVASLVADKIGGDHETMRDA